jgi:hypothetical protein
VSLLLSLLGAAAAAPHWTQVADRPDAAQSLGTDDDACVRSATTTLPGRSPELSWATYGTCMAERGWVCPLPSVTVRTSGWRAPQPGVRPAAVSPRLGQAR